MKSELCSTHSPRLMVAPLVGAWIEIDSVNLDNPYVVVAPLVGAWIEIVYKGAEYDEFLRRSSCRSVD